MNMWTEICRLVLTGQKSKRAVCDEYEIHWETLQKILAHEEPPGYRLKKPRPKPKLGPFLSIIHEILNQDRKAPKKQRHTAKRIFERLRDEYGYEGKLTIVKDAVREWKRTRAEAEIPEPCPENYPRWQTLRFDVPERGPLPQARIHWYNAAESELKRQGIWKRLEKIAGRSLEWKANSWTPRSGSLLVGSKGVVHTNAHNSICALLPESDFPDQGGPPQSLPRAGSHEREWLQACRGGRAALSNFDHSGPAIELMLLGNVATLVGQPLEFDPVACGIAGNKEADRALRPPHREGWSL